MPDECSAFLKMFFENKWLFIVKQSSMLSNERQNQHKKFYFDNRKHEFET